MRPRLTQQFFRGVLPVASNFQDEDGAEGTSLIGLRFFAAVALGLVLVLTGLMARHLGGGRQAQIVAAPTHSTDFWERNSASKRFS